MNNNYGLHVFLLLLLAEIKEESFLLLPCVVIIESVLASNGSAGEVLTEVATWETLKNHLPSIFDECYYYMHRSHRFSLVDHLHELSLVVVVCSLLLLPPGSEASLGNSLNTSEEELHTAGIMMAPKGTRGVYLPSSST